MLDYSCVPVKNPRWGELYISLHFILENELFSHFSFV